MKRVPLTCPCCQKALAPARLMRHATEVRTRTCRSCRSVWAVKLSPRSTEQAVFTTVEYREKSRSV